MTLPEKIANFIKENDLSFEDKSQRSYIFDCPVCTAAGKYYIDKENGRTTCFRAKESDCPQGAKVEWGLHLLTQKPFAEIKRYFNDDYSNLNVGSNKLTTEIFKDEVIREESFVEEDHQLMEAGYNSDFIDIDDDNAEEGLQYLLGRGLDEDLLAKYKVKYSPNMRRVVFPVFDDVQLVGWQARSIDADVDKNFRMYNLPGIWKSKSIMFLENISEKVIIAEGAVSALKFKLVGGFVATMGKSINKIQMDIILSKEPERVYLALDSDAYNEIVDLSKVLNERGIKCYLIATPDHRGDFGDCTYEECLQAFNEAKEYTGNELITPFWKD